MVLPQLQEIINQQAAAPAPANQLIYHFNMNIENTEINGFFFLIDNFNQHSLKPGGTQGHALCALTLDNLKRKIRMLQCASYDWERGLGTCHNCDTSFQLHTYQRKGNAIKEYVKPIPVEVFEPVKDKAVEWFKTRGITQQTLDDLNVTTGERVYASNRPKRKYYTI